MDYAAVHKETTLKSLDVENYDQRNNLPSREAIIFKKLICPENVYFKLLGQISSLLSNFGGYKVIVINLTQIHL